MIVVSKLKEIFSGDLMRYIAAICDTRRIDSNREKMITLGNLLYTYGIDFEILGGASNRIALQIDGYAIKFAMDEQGYRDNWVEYALSPELQPYVTKSYETNGYILVAECVEVMTKDKFQMYKNEILKILDRLCQDYLLGDVGYIKKNMTNWGIRNGAPVILDYAYCHRATEGLFTCGQCGNILSYDSCYDKLMCTNRVGGCSAVYTYNDRKKIQGDEVDLTMIRDRKSESIRLEEGVSQKEIETFNDRLLGDNFFVIDNPGDMHRYQLLKEAIKMKIWMNGGNADMMSAEDKFEAMVDILSKRNVEEAQKVLFQSVSEEEEAPEAVYTDNYQQNYMNGFIPPMRTYAGIGEQSDDEDDAEEKDTEFDMESGLEALVAAAQKRREDEKNRLAQQQRDLDEAYAAETDKYLTERQNGKKKGGNGKPAVVVHEQSEEPVSQTGTDEPKAVESTEVSAEDPHQADEEVGQDSSEDGATADYTEGDEGVGRYQLVPTDDSYPEPNNFAIWDNDEGCYYAIDGEVVTFETPEEADEFLEELYTYLPVDPVEGTDDQGDEEAGEETNPADEEPAEEPVYESRDTDEASLLVEGEPIHVGQEVKISE